MRLAATYELLRARDRGRLTPTERTSNDKSIRHTVLALFKTRMLRLEKLGVLDEGAKGFRSASTPSPA